VNKGLGIATVFSKMLSTYLRLRTASSTRVCLLARAPPCIGHRPLQRALSSASKAAPPSPEEKKGSPLPEEQKPSRWEQIKATFREHGPVFVAYYGTTWLGGFGVCWAGVTVAGVDGVALLQYLGADSVMDTNKLSPWLINALIAGEINELADFVRLPFVIATTPALSRRLKAMRGGSTPS
jgi:Protein of unknown function (DUF1279)